MPSRRVADEVRIVSVRVPLAVFESLVTAADERGVKLAVVARERLAGGLTVSVEPRRMTEGSQVLPVPSGADGNVTFQIKVSGEYEPSTDLEEREDAAVASTVRPLAAPVAAELARRKTLPPSTCVHAWERGRSGMTRCTKCGLARP